MSSPEPTLDFEELTTELAADLEGISVSSDGGVLTYRRGRAAFARAAAVALEVRLPEDIAEAALRTPDTYDVAGQPGWVRFAPTGGERHVIDRAAAWFQTAWRHAGIG
jgi:hypothetical protein